ncbi:hypothetical protein FD755_009252, partial [Muntiacus reevesi]
MDVERLQEALKDFEKRGKKEVCPVLDQFLCHVAKTGETIWNSLVLIKIISHLRNL